MSIPSFIKKICVQPCVYWGSPVEDGYGGKTFADPVEIKCRWEDIVRKIKTSNGSETESKATVLVTEDLDFEGYLYLGTLDEVLALDAVVNLESGEVFNPKSIDRAFQIIGMDRISLVKSTTEFVRTVYLGFKNI